MKLWNVIRLVVGSAACTALLMACADGRGTNGFKSYRYSKEDIAKAQAARAAKAASENPQRDGGGTNDTTPAAEARPGSGTPAPAPATSGGASPVVPGTNRPLFNPLQDSALAKQFNEPEQQVGASVKDLMVTIDEELSRPSKPAGQSSIKGISIRPSGSNSERAITIEAIVNIGGEDLFLGAVDQRIRFPKEEDQLPNLVFRLTKPCDQNAVVLAKKSVWVAAKCRDQNCWAIEVVLSFEVNEGRSNEVLVVETGRNAKGETEWQITKTNFGKPKPVEEGMAACPSLVPPAPKPTESTPANSGGGVNPTAADTSAAAKADEETAKREKAEMEAAEKKRCEAVKAEGFSCEDSPSEIARMRAARVQAAAAEKAKEKAEMEVAEKKRCEAVKAEGFSCEDSPSEIARMRAARAAAPAPVTKPASTGAHLKHRHRR